MSCTTGTTIRNFFRRDHFTKIRAITKSLEQKQLQLLFIKEIYKVSFLVISIYQPIFLDVFE